jgi:hypothetical protein
MCMYLTVFFLDARHWYYCLFFILLIGAMRGGSANTSVRVPERQEGARESQKGPISLAKDVLF